MYSTRTSTAFTLIEILVAIGIIGALVSIVIVTARSSKDSANAAKTVEQFQIIESGLRDYFADQEFFTGEDVLGLGPNPSIETLRTNGILNDFFNTAPTAVFGTLRDYHYDNDRTVSVDDFYAEDGCTFTGNEEMGVNIMLDGVFEYAPRVADEVDRLIDKGDGFSCGRIRRDGASGQYLIYMVSPKYTQI
jgi:prepilin-type N-terminal cleavage/methylation domain-containing protein